MKKKMEAQSISKTELVDISAFHQRRLGWSYLLENTIADRIVGFPCENEEFLVRRELKKAFNKVSEWFRTMGRKYDWPSLEGWVWEVDFESSQVVPKKQYLQPGKTESKDNSEKNKLVEGPVMALGEKDFDIVKRLLEKRESLADFVRSHLRLFLNGEVTMDKLNPAVQQLGCADKDVRDWFSEMATTYKWPRIEDTNWRYSVDMDEKKVYLKPGGICSCS